MEGFRKEKMVSQWEVGQVVLADWCGTFYEARIKEILDDGSGNISAILTYL